MNDRQKSFWKGAFVRTHIAVGDVHQQDGPMISREFRQTGWVLHKTDKKDWITGSLCQAVDSNGLIDDDDDLKTSP